MHHVRGLTVVLFTTTSTKIHFIESRYSKREYCSNEKIKNRANLL